MTLQTILPFKFTAILWLAAAMPLQTQASTVRVAGHRYPTRVEAKDLTWQLQGAEHFRYRLFSVFTGAFYKAPETAARRLTFTYTRNIDRDTLVEQGNRVLREAHDRETLQKRKDYLDKVNAAYQDVSSGDRYTFTVIPGKGTWLHFNDQEKLFLEDADFGLWYLDIWLGEKPMSEKFRDALLNSEDA
ncbi:MAG: chalcone isomerase family protein [Verrucomicrobia bacterium]|nr:chalcone isomerase family protein [Verrucomicrobiota bacterium]MCH8511355.1 chalcone isomerase family protein [Kiritimatiellia bacterium]